MFNMVSAIQLISYLPDLKTPQDSALAGRAPWGGVPVKPNGRGFGSQPGHAGETAGQCSLSRQYACPQMRIFKNLQFSLPGEFDLSPGQKVKHITIF